MFNETKHTKPLLVNHTVWEDGQTGSVSGFSQNGATSENYRKIDTDPWGKEVVVWESAPEGNGNADGGWNSTAFAVDNTKMYRFSVWIRRTVIGNGSYYLGPTRITDALRQRSNNDINNNPYFYNGSWPSSVPENAWMLIVGHVWPVGSGAGDNHPDSGRYTVESGRVGDISRDFIFDEAAATIGHRAYLFYSTDTSTRQQFVYPRVDIIDGTEPSIEELLAGHDSRNYEFIRSVNGQAPPLSVTKDMTRSSKVSEVSLTNGLVAWYPLINDTDDYINRNDGVNNGAVAVSDGYEFETTNDLIVTKDIREIVGNSTSSITFSAWINMTAIDNDINMFMGQTLPYFGFRSSRSIYFSTEIEGAQRNLTSSSQYNLGEWYLATFTFDNGTMRIYVNGVIDGENQNYEGSMTFRSGQFSFGDGRSSNWYPFIGKMRDVRVYDRALNSNEVARLYNTTKPDGIAVSLASDGIFIKNQIKEV